MFDLQFHHRTMDNVDDVGGKAFRKRDYEGSIHFYQSDVNISK